MLTLARQRDPGRAETLLDETSAATAAASGSHGWLWRLRLVQARAELALAAATSMPRSPKAQTASIRAARKAA